MRVTRNLLAVSDEEFLRVRVASSATMREVVLRWRGKARSGAATSTDLSAQSVSFLPTAWTRSRVDPKAFVIAGRSALGLVLEQWRFEDDGAVTPEWIAAAGRWNSKLERATLTRTPLPIAATLGNVCNLTTVLLPGPVATEELWLFEWESRSVFAVMAATGALTLRVPAAIAAPFRTITARSHSIYGEVVSFERKPWQMAWSNWLKCVRESPGLDPDLQVLFDQDRDGVMEGSFVIPWDTVDTHPLYATGSFTDLDE